MVVSSTLTVLPADARTPVPPDLALGLEGAAQLHQGDCFTHQDCWMQRADSRGTVSQGEGCHLGAQETSFNVKQGLFPAEQSALNVNGKPKRRDMREFTCLDTWSSETDVLLERKRSLPHALHKNWIPLSPRLQAHLHWKHLLQGGLPVPPSLGQWVARAQHPVWAGFTTVLLLRVGACSIHSTATGVPSGSR